MVKIKFNTNSISGSLQEEKKEVVAFVERKLDGLNLDYKWISEANRIDLVEQIARFYRLEVTNKNGWESRYDFLSAKSGWLEKIKDAQSKEDLKVIERCLGRVIAAFGAKETPKFREISTKLTELETELKKDEINQSRVSSLKNEIIPKFTRKTEGEHHNLDDFYYSPIVYTYFDKNLVEEIERQNQKNIPTKNANDDARFDYSTFQELKEGKHEIVRKYKELATKIFDNYNNRNKRAAKEEYKNIDVQLSREIVSEDWNLDNFWDTDNSYISESYRKHCKQKNQIGLRSRVRIIEKMEQLINKAEQVNNDKKRKNENEESNNDLPESKRLKGAEIEKSKDEITKKITSEQEEVKNEISNSLQGIESKSPEEQGKELEKIEKQNNGQKAYQEQKEKVDKLKDKLAQNNPQKYGKLAARNIAERISAAGALILDEKTQVKLENLKNGKITDATQARKTEEEVIHQVNLAIATKKLNELLTEIEKLGKNEKAKEKGSDLFKYISDANIYHRQVYQINKSQVDKILAEQGFIQTSNKTDSPSGFFQPKVLIPVGIVAVVLATAALIIRNKKQKKIKGF